MAVLLPAAAYRELTKKEKPGLLSAMGALADLDKEIDDLCALIYQEREKAKDREVSL